MVPVVFHAFLVGNGEQLLKRTEQLLLNAAACRFIHKCMIVRLVQGAASEKKNARAQSFASAVHVHQECKAPEHLFNHIKVRLAADWSLAEKALCSGI